MAAPKFRTPTDKARALADVARLDRQGFGQTDIAKRLGVSQPAVCHWLKRVKANYRDQALVEYREKVHEAVAALRDIRAEAWLAWERSKEDAEKEVVETAPGKSRKTLKPDRRGETALQTIQRLKRIVTREGRLPASEYLQILLKTWAMECELYGIDAEKAPVNLLVNVNQNGSAAVDWDWTPMTKREPVPDPVAEAVALLPPKVVQAGEAPVAPEGPRPGSGRNGHLA